MGKQDREWLAYTNAEVRALCEEKAWGYQIRRNWAARKTPVDDSPLEDFEWKLIPGASGRLPDDEGKYEGEYYVLRVERAHDRFRFQHDTLHVGVQGPHWERATYTDICLPGCVDEFSTFADERRVIQHTHRRGRLSSFVQRILGAGTTRGEREQMRSAGCPPEGWLRSHLLDLIRGGCGPNRFSFT